MNRSNIPCWQCRRRLIIGNDGKIIFVVITLPGGNTVKVHKACAEEARRALTLNEQVGSDARKGPRPQSINPDEL